MDLNNGKSIQYATLTVKNEDLESKRRITGLRQQLHLSPVEPSSDQSNLSISNILLTMVLCITLKPNGKLSANFGWLDMGLPNTGKESNTLNASVFT